MARTASLPTVNERVGIVETKIENIEGKIDDLKDDVKGINTTIEKSHNELIDKLKSMQDASTTQHRELAGKIKDLEQFKQKWVYLIMGGLAALGWVSGHIDKISEYLK